MKKFLAMAAALVAVSFVCGTLAQDHTTYYWTGAIDSNYQTPGNWTYWIGGPPADDVPVDWNDFSMILYFTEAASPSTKTINNTAWDQKCWLLDMADPGWEISRIHAYYINSRGDGTNTINGQLNAPTGKECVWTIAPENTLVSYGIYNNSYGNGITLNGGGMLHCKGRNDGWGEAKYFIIKNALLRVDDYMPIRRGDDWSNMGVVYLADKDARVQYVNTITDAKSRFNWMIANNYGHGHTLHAEDVGGGYVEVSLLPPSTILLLK